MPELRRALRPRTEVIGRYRDLGIGLADASIVVLATRFEANRVLTLDERHFRALPTADGQAVTIRRQSGRLGLPLRLP